MLEVARICSRLDAPEYYTIMLYVLSIPIAPNQLTCIDSVNRNSCSKTASSRLQDPRRVIQGPSGHCPCSAGPVDEGPAESRLTLTSVVT